MDAPKAIGFDIEISTAMPSEQFNDKNKWPDRLGVSCVGLAIPGMNGGGVCISPPFVSDEPGARYAPSLTDDQIHSLLLILDGYINAGVNVVSINGLGFDLFVLGRESGNPEVLHLAAKIAMRHIDIGWQMVAEHGFMVGLDAMGRGMKVGGKGEVHGADAPVLWAGSREDQEKVLAYVMDDATKTLAIFDAICHNSFALQWFDRHDALQAKWMQSSLNGDRLLTVGEAYKLAQPYHSWDRGKFINWALDAAAKL